MVFICEVWIDTDELYRGTDLEGKETVCDLADLVVGVSNRYTGLLRMSEWSCLIMAIDCTKNERTGTIVGLNQF